MTTLRATLLVVTLGLTASACERQPEADHLAEIQALCGELRDAGAGAAEAEHLFGGPPQLELCATDLLPASAQDACPRDGTAVCVRLWAYRARSRALCGGPGCSYGCELRAVEGSPEATCSVRFLQGLDGPGLPEEP